MLICSDELFYYWAVRVKRSLHEVGTNSALGVLRQ